MGFDFGQRLRQVAPLAAEVEQPLLVEVVQTIGGARVGQHARHLGRHLRRRRQLPRLRGLQQRVVRLRLPQDGRQPRRNLPRRQRHEAIGADLGRRWPDLPVVKEVRRLKHALHHRPDGRREAEAQATHRREELQEVRLLAGGDRSAVCGLAERGDELRRAGRLGRRSGRCLARARQAGRQLAGRFTRCQRLHGGVDDRVGGLVVERHLQIGDAVGGDEPDGVRRVRRPGVSTFGRRGGVAEQIRQHVVVFAVGQAPHHQYARLLGWRRPRRDDPDVLGDRPAATAARAGRGRSAAARSGGCRRAGPGPTGPRRVRGHTAERAVAGAHAGGDQNRRHRPDAAQVSTLLSSFHGRSPFAVGCDAWRHVQPFRAVSSPP